MPELAPHPGDSQRVEILGRNRLIDELLRDNLEVAVPVRDHGIDLIVYADTAVTAYSSKPIQMKASWKQGFSIDRKYEKFPDLIIAYVWNLGDPPRAVTYAMNYAEAHSIASVMGWTKTASWERGNYANSQPSPALIERLLPFKMVSGSWWDKIASNRL